MKKMLSFIRKKVGASTILQKIKSFPKQTISEIKNTTFTPRQRFLLAMGVISLGLFFGASFLFSNDNINVNTYLETEVVAMLLGLFVAIVDLESFLELPFGKLSIKIASTVVLGGLGYFGHKNAVDDVNTIFHHDASAFPMTVTADSIIHVLILLAYLFGAISVFSFLNLMFLVVKKCRENLAEQLVACVVKSSHFYTCGLFTIFVFSQFYNMPNRLQKVYRIAHATDFNSTFQCAGVDENKFSVVFIGSDQKRILIAPKVPLPSPELLKGKHPTAEILQHIDIRKVFPVADCVPSVDAQKWMEEKA